MAWYSFFKRLVTRAVQIAEDEGLTDDAVDLALKWVRVAAKKTVGSAEKREWVVQVLAKKGKLNEGIARIAVELAYGLYLRELAPKFEEQ